MEASNSSKAVPFCLSPEGVPLYFGIPALTTAQQKALLDEAIHTKKFPFDNTRATEARQACEDKRGVLKKGLPPNQDPRKQRMIGYCMSNSCRNHPTGPKHSAPIGDCLHCVDHLAEAITISRRNGDGLQFIWQVGDQTQITGDPRDMHYIRFDTDGSIIHKIGSKTDVPENIILSTETGKPVIINTDQAKWVPMESVETNYRRMPWRLVMPGPIKIGTSVIHNATGIACMKGRYYCSNIAHGIPCVSMDPNYKQEGFRASVTRRGASGWKEETTNANELGLISIYMLCQGCAIRSKVSPGSTPNSTPGSSGSSSPASPSSPLTPITMPAISNIQQAMKEMFRQIHQLQQALSESENTRLQLEKNLAESRKTEAALRAELLRYQCEKLADGKQKINTGTA